MSTEPYLRPVRRTPPWRLALLGGVVAVAAFAATDAVLRLVSDQESPASTPTSTPAPAGGAAAGGGAASPGAPSATGAPPASAAGEVPATQDPAAKDTGGADTNVEDAAEGPRRAAPAKPADEEAPEFRESADNNITLPVDI